MIIKLVKPKKLLISLWNLINFTPQKNYSEKIFEFEKGRKKKEKAKKIKRKLRVKKKEERFEKD